MKNYLSISLMFLASMFFATTTNAQDKKTQKADSWPEKAAFHAVMSTTFHPAEEGNLQPIKTRSEELVKAATAWMNSTPPAEFNKPEIKEKLKYLYAESVELDRLVKSGAGDEQLKGVLSKLHDRFHEIVGLCRKDGKAEEHKNH